MNGMHICVDLAQVYSYSNSFNHTYNLTLLQIKSNKLMKYIYKHINNKYLDNQTVF